MADGVRLLALLIESVVIEVVAVDFAQTKYRRGEPSRTSLWRKSRIRPGPGAIEPVH